MTQVILQCISYGVLNVLKHQSLQTSVISQYNLIKFSKDMIYEIN